MIIDALVPVKAAAAGKERLAALLSPAERAELVRAMLRDVVSALRASPYLRTVAVTSPDAAMLALAVELGAHPLPEPPAGGGLNGALAAAINRLARDGAEAVLIVQGDVPRLGAGDLAALLAPPLTAAGNRPILLSPPAVSPPAPPWSPTGASDSVAAPPGDGEPVAPLVRAVPSADGGTSALLLRPPTVIAPAFGPDSFACHRVAALAAGALFERCERPALAWDVDRPEDIARLLRDSLPRENDAPAGDGHDGGDPGDAPPAGLAAHTRAALHRLAASARLAVIDSAGGEVS